MYGAHSDMPVGEKIPRTIYAALVESMCQNFWPMITGTICAAAGTLMTAVKTGNPLIWPILFLIVGIGTLRAFQMRKHEMRTEALTFEEAQIWEPEYRLGAVVYAAALGVWCYVVLLGSNDPVAHMICIAVTIGYSAGGAARNYGRPLIVQLHILAACGPMSLALAVHGDLYYIGLAILLVLFFVGLKIINLKLHEIFVKALLATERESALASQFDTALNNMPHGLCMFGSGGGLVVVNKRFVEMMNLGSGYAPKNMPARDASTGEQKALFVFSAWV